MVYKLNIFACVYFLLTIVFGVAFIILVCYTLKHGAKKEEKSG